MSFNHVPYTRYLGFFLLGVGIFSYIMSKMAPSCYLCDIERWIVLFTAFSLISPFYTRTFNFIARCFLILLTITALYHCALQFNIIRADPSFCKAVSFDIDANISSMRTTCKDKTTTLFSIPLPVYVLFLSIFSLLALSYESHISDRRKPKL